MLRGHDAIVVCGRPLCPSRLLATDEERFRVFHVTLNHSIAPLRDQRECCRRLEQTLSKRSTFGDMSVESRASEGYRSTSKRQWLEPRRS